MGNPIAKTIQTPIIKDRSEVALLDFINTHNIITKTRILRNASFLSENRFLFPRITRRSHEKKRPQTKHKLPSIFLLVAIPLYDAAPVHGSYPLPK
jgi:hypothetical protein